MNIGVLFSADPQEQQMLTDAAGGNRIDFLDKHISGPALAPYEVLIGFPSLAQVQDAASLHYLQLTTAGADRYLKCRHVQDRSVLLASASGAYGCGESEWMLALTMMMFKKLHLYRDHMHLESGRWCSCGKVKAICGSTIVCIGTGDIGTEYARRVKALGAHVIGVCRTKAHSDVFDEIYTQHDCASLFSRADAVALALPSTQETYHFLSREYLSSMRSDAYLINAGRGDTVDTEALIEALQRNSIAGAALDVMEQEPLPDSSPLWELPNVMLTPHVAGGFNLSLTKSNIISLVSNNLSRYVNGEVPLHLVNPDAGY